MHLSIPGDIRAEIVCNYLESIKKEFVFQGNHKRNAYEDILSVSQDGEVVKLALSRQGLYDILPEALFHPIDRFDNIPANEYKERFAEEVEQQLAEEANARSFFLLYDKFIFDLNSVVSQIKNSEFNNNRVLSDIICDSLQDKYKSNRFVVITKEFIPRCHSIRGNATLITLMLRKVMADEGLKLVRNDKLTMFEDKTPRYNCQLVHEDDSHELYLGNHYYENVLCYDVHYWNEDFCNESFLKFVDEIKVYEDFINNYFMGIETSIHFNISAQTLPVRLSDELCYNYLNYNINI
jgi:hypothetical protein